jgi:hypothetical protein
MPDHLESRPDEKVVCVPKNDLRLQLAQLPRAHCLYTPLRSHRHERRSLDDAVTSGEPTTPRP